MTSPSTVGRGRGMSDQPAEQLYDEGHATLDCVSARRVGWIEGGRDPQLRQRLLSRSPRILQKPAELRDSALAAGLSYV